MVFFMMLKLHDSICSLYYALASLLRIRTVARWNSRAHYSTVFFISRFAQRVGRVAIQNPLSFNRMDHFNYRLLFTDRACFARSICEKILAYLDERHATPGSIGQFTDADGCRNSAASLHGRGTILELADVDTIGRRDLLAPAAVDTNRCRSVLENLLAPLAPAQARAWSTRLIKRFGTLSAVLTSDTHNIMQAVNDERLPAFLNSIHKAHLHTLRMAIDTSPIISDSNNLINYLTTLVAYEPRECLRILFLNSSNKLLADEEFGKGSINHMPLYPREIIRRALELRSTAIIVVHNHPSGSSKPSESDINATKKLVNATVAFDIVVHDHLIIATGGYSSFRIMGII